MAQCKKSEDRTILFMMIFLAAIVFSLLWGNLDKEKTYDAQSQIIYNNITMSVDEYKNNVFNVKLSVWLALFSSIALIKLCRKNSKKKYLIFTFLSILTSIFVIYNSDKMIGTALLAFTVTFVLIVFTWFFTQTKNSNLG